MKMTLYCPFKWAERENGTDFCLE